MDKWHPKVKCEICGVDIAKCAIKRHIAKHRFLEQRELKTNHLKDETSVYEGKIVYGPYTRKDNRQFVVVKTPGSLEDHRTISYPKYLVEVALNRYLDSDEQIDHIDGDFLNNSFDNLRILKHSDHARSHTMKVLPLTGVCPICGSSFTFYPENFRKTCSKHCAGVLSHHPDISALITKPASKYLSRRNDVDVLTVRELLSVSNAGVAE